MEWVCSEHCSEMPDKDHRQHSATVNDVLNIQIWIFQASPLARRQQSPLRSKIAATE